MSRFHTFIKELPKGKGAHPELPPGTIGQFDAHRIAGWRKVDGAPIDHVDPTLRREAVEVLRAAFREKGPLVAEAMKSPIWHLRGGMTVRNTLRSSGYTEARLGVANLDDIYQELAREAIELGPRPATRRAAGFFRLLWGWALRRLAAGMYRLRRRLAPGTATEAPPPPPPLTGDESAEAPKPLRGRWS